ncbi:hypothetical protein ACFQS3_07100 [Glycomyces mayteni]|uniref:Uncharacterized protein n=1 Tax=Glycomyces mayteni TaxID=543887 RepID=A0ABW2D653_9ACTN|nr:hypothetical protein GCM10025732_23220 [Glycomyces mayteni]
MAKQRKPPPRFIVVARTGSGRWPHPVEVGVHPAGKDSLVSFSIGPHAVNAGGVVPIGNVLLGDELNPMFSEEFEAAELHWLVPLLVRLRGGEDVAEEIRSAYTALHGRRPETM